MKGTTMSVKVKRHHVSKVDRYGIRQPRPATRRTGTRFGAVRAAIQEG